MKLELWVNVDDMTAVRSGLDLLYRNAIDTFALVGQPGLTEDDYGLVSMAWGGWRLTRESE